jgi:hypothetical protein
LTVNSAIIGTGQLGFVAHTSLSYDGGSGPSSLITKLPSTDPRSRGMGAATGVYEAEVRFYRDIAPTSKARVPALYAAALDAATGRFTLLLEDLSSTMDVGDMVGGGTVDQAALAVSELVPLQAPIWNAPTVTEPDWLGTHRPQMLFDQVQNAVAPFLERFGPRLGDDHIRLVERLAPKATAVTGIVWQPPLVISHGDYRLDNMMFGRAESASPIALIDWQGARSGPPLLDAAIYLSSCLSPEQRRAVERDLLRDYHTSSSTMMYGHVDEPRHWVGHLRTLASIQDRTGGFTEFVPLPFVHQNAPIYLAGLARRGRPSGTTGPCTRSPGWPCTGALTTSSAPG